MLTTAVKTGGGYRLNGTKRWITNGSVANVALVWAKLEGRVHGFLVPTTTKGFAARDIHGKWSLRASVTSELVLEDCEVGEDALLPGVSGMRGPLSCLSQARFGICYGAVGAAMACYDEALRYAQDRVQFSRPIAGYQLVQQKLVDMVAEITKAQLVCWRLGRLKEAETITAGQISLAKRNNVAMARDIARDARDILGANGVTDDYQCGRHMLNLESVYTYEGTHDIHTLVVGQDITVVVFCTVSAVTTPTARPPSSLTTRTSAISPAPPDGSSPAQINTSGRAPTSARAPSVTSRRPPGR
jgi:glutaryl-CoA dehydrogenase